MRELYRRAGALVCLLFGLTLFFHVQSPVIRLKPLDVAERYREAYAPRKGWGALEAGRAFVRSTQNFLPLPAFLQKELEGRALTVEGDAWASVFSEMYSPSPGRFYVEEDPDFFRQRYYVLPREEPFRELVNSSALEGIGYLEFLSALGPRYVNISLMGPGDVLSEGMPSFFVFPLRYLSWVFFLAGFGIYLFVRSPKKSPQDLGYAKWWSTLLPDVAGFIFTGFFFAFPLVLVPRVGDGAFWIMLIFWGMATLFASILYFSARYAAFSLRLLPDRMELATLRGRKTILFSRISRVDFADYRLPRWVRMLVFLASFLDYRLAGQSLILSSPKDWGLLLILPQGEKEKFLCSGLGRIEELFQALERAKVPLSAEVEEIAKALKKG